MYLIEPALQSASKQKPDSLCNQWQTATNDNKLAQPELKEYIEGEQQWLEDRAYQHERYLYADRL